MTTSFLCFNILCTKREFQLFSEKISTKNQVYHFFGKNQNGLRGGKKISTHTHTQKNNGIRLRRRDRKIDGKTNRDNEQHRKVRLHDGVSDTDCRHVGDINFHHRHTLFYNGTMATFTCCDRRRRRTGSCRQVPQEAMACDRL